MEQGSEGEEQGAGGLAPPPPPGCPRVPRARRLMWARLHWGVGVTNGSCPLTSHHFSGKKALVCLFVCFFFFWRVQLILAHAGDRTGNFGATSIKPTDHCWWSLFGATNTLTN